VNRRQMVILPGIALAASRGFAQTQDAAPASSSFGTISHKVTAHYSRIKSFSTIPKTAAKQAKYIGSLGKVLSLSPAQQDETASIFAAASSSDATLKKSIKTTRQSLGEAVKNNDSAAISEASVAIGTLLGQRHLIGAKANAAFFQVLTADQQARFNQLKA
jgi:Spy/CpxP family protein refolding chaperone